MYIQILGLNHKTAPIDIREKVSFSHERLSDALKRLRCCDSIEEDIIISTCNRTEIYTAVKDLPRGCEAVREFLSDFGNIDSKQLTDCIYSYSDRKAIEHLFRVASSLDSMIIGETQVLGQVKEAFSLARQANTVGRNLNIVFEEALRIGKKVRTETQIGKGAVSTSTAAIELAKKIFETLENKKALIIGAGKIGELTVKNLFSRGVSTVMVANRTHARALELAKVFGGRAIRFEDIPQELAQTDIIISSTSAPHFLLTREDIAKTMLARNNSPLFIIDLGVPRNIDPQANSVDNVYIYNIDDLAQVRDANLRERMSEAVKAEKIISSHVELVIKNIALPDMQKELNTKK